MWINIKGIPFNHFWSKIWKAAGDGLTTVGRSEAGVGELQSGRSKKIKNEQGKSNPGEYHKNYDEARCTLLDNFNRCHQMAWIGLSDSSMQPFPTSQLVSATCQTCRKLQTLKDKVVKESLAELGIGNQQHQRTIWNCETTWLLPGSCVCWDATNLAPVLQLDQHSAPQGWSWDYNQTGISCSTMIWQLVLQWCHHASIPLVSGVYS